METTITVIDDITNTQCMGITKATNIPNPKDSAVDALLL